ncbi:efflux RND transporter periplasmic adaptor subunit [Pseudomaricurvus hydrocarbonicus]
MPPKLAIPTYELRLTGNLNAAQTASLSTRVGGLVSGMNVDVGDQVQTGDILLTLDPTIEQHRLQQAKATTAAAQADYEEKARLVKEAERLTKTNHLPMNELTLRQAALATSSALLDAAKAEQQAQAVRVNWHALKAPFSGVISQKFTETGEWVTPGTAVLQLVSIDTVYLDVQVPQVRFNRITPQTRVNVKPDTHPNLMVTGRIGAIVPVSNSGTRTFQVRVMMDNTEMQLLPGTSATAEFQFTQSDEPALLIPKDALLRGPDGSYSVFIVTEADGKTIAQRRRLELGEESNGSVVVKDGLQTGDLVVIRGNEILRHGQAVNILSDR